MLYRVIRLVEPLGEGYDTALERALTDTAAHLSETVWSDVAQRSLPVTWRLVGVTANHRAIFEGSVRGG